MLLEAAAEDTQTLKCFFCCALLGPFGKAHRIRSSASAPRPRSMSSVLRLCSALIVLGCVGPIVRRFPARASLHGRRPGAIRPVSSVSA